MVETKAGIYDFGWPAPDFALKGVDGKTYTLSDVRGQNGTLVVFVCNHCPYVKASIDASSRRPRPSGRLASEPSPLCRMTRRVTPKTPLTACRRSRRNTASPFHMSSMKLKTWREPTMFNAHRISSASTRKMNCNIGGGSMLHASSHSQIRAATCF